MLKPNAKGKANINSQKCIYIKLCHVYAALEKATTSGNKQGKTSVTISPGSQTFTLIPPPATSLSCYNHFFTSSQIYIFQKYTQC